MARVVSPIMPQLKIVEGMVQDLPHVEAWARIPKDISAHTKTARGQLHLVSATDRFLSIGTLIKSTFHLSLLVIKGPP